MYVYMFYAQHNIKYIFLKKALVVPSSSNLIYNIQYIIRQYIDLKKKKKKKNLCA